MPIFHIIAVRAEPPAAEGELPTVRKTGFLVFAPSLPLAFESVTQAPAIKSATEVYGAIPRIPRDGLVIGPESLCHVELLVIHRNWVRTHDHYLLLRQSGPSLDAQFAPGAFLAASGASA